jgi:cytochrome c oxidase subunit 1
MMSRKLGFWVAGMIILGFNLAFGPMHYLGLIGMPRRTHTYLATMGWENWNFVCTIGAYILGVGVFLCFYDMVRTVLGKDRNCGPDPWDARTLEWSLTSPVQPYNFAQTPVVSCRDAWWAQKHQGEPIEYEAADVAHGVHMPSQSWMPLGGGVGFYIFGMGMVLMSAGVPYCGYVGIFGLIITALFIFLWALEGPGGYHLIVPAQAAPRQPTPTPRKEHAGAGHHH